MLVPVEIEVWAWNAQASCSKGDVTGRALHVASAWRDIYSDDAAGDVIARAVYCNCSTPLHAKTQRIKNIVLDLLAGQRAWGKGGGRGKKGGE